MKVGRLTLIFQRKLASCVAVCISNAVRVRKSNKMVITQHLLTSKFASFRKWESCQLGA